MYKIDWRFGFFSNDVQRNSHARQKIRTWDWWQRVTYSSERGARVRELNCSRTFECPLPVSVCVYRIVLKEQRTPTRWFLTRIEIMLEMKSRAHFMRAFNDNYCRTTERILAFLSNYRSQISLIDIKLLLSHDDISSVSVTIDFFASHFCSNML